MTDKGCVKIGEPLAAALSLAIQLLLQVCLQLSLCSTSRQSMELASFLTSGLFLSCSGFWSGTYIWDATTTHDPQSRHAVVSAVQGAELCWLRVMWSTSLQRCHRGQGASCAAAKDGAFPAQVPSTRAAARSDDTDHQH